MIVEWMMQLGIGILDIMYSMLGVLPSFSTDVTNAINTFFDIIFGAVSLVSIFVDIEMVKILVPLAIGIINFDKIIKLVMFIVKKIPIINVK